MPNFYTTCTLILSVFAVLPAKAADALPADSRAILLIKNTLEDPDHAVFSDVYTIASAKGVGVCGLVNARDASGDYTGRRPFLVTGDQVLIFNPDGKAESANEMIDAVCLGQGETETSRDYPIKPPSM